MGVYGDGSAGAFTVTSGSFRDLTILDPATNLQFTTITVNGTLIVPSGTILRATGDVTVGQTGMIIVDPGARPTPVPGSAASAGLALSPAVVGASGVGMRKLSAAALGPLPSAGGAGVVTSVPTPGSAGGGSIGIYAAGTVTVAAAGSINANGGSGVSAQGGTGNGSGGGAGGLVVVAGRTGITVSGAIRVAGGNGANGVAPTGAAHGGAGGGGGIVHLLSTTAPTVTGTLLTSGGAGGQPAGAGTAPGGGAGGGSLGGSGGTTATGSGPATAGGAAANGWSITTVTPTPENLLVG